MIPASPYALKLAGLLIARESKQKSPLGNAIPAFAVCAKLRPSLSTLMGTTGFHALLSRALMVARAEEDGLFPVQVTAAGLLETSAAMSESVSPEELEAGCLALVSRLLGLLDAFIGAELTLRMVNEVWPDLDFENFDSRHTQ